MFHIDRCLSNGSHPLNCFVVTWMIQTGEVGPPARLRVTFVPGPRKLEISSMRSRVATRELASFHPGFARDVGLLDATRRLVFGAALARLLLVTITTYRQYV